MKRRGKNKASTTKTAALERKRVFIESVMAGQNQTQAAVTAGYSPRNARHQGSRMATDPNIAAEIARRRAALLTKYEINSEDVMRELARIAYFDAGKCYDEHGKPLPIHSIPEDTRRALAGIKDGEIKAFSKPDALRSAMQHLGLIKRQQINVNAQSVAAASVQTMEPEKRTDLEVARRIAYVLHLGAEAAKTAPPVAAVQPAKPVKKRAKQPA